MTPSKACKIFIASAVLHNICKDLGLPEITSDDDDSDSDIDHDSDTDGDMNDEYDGEIVGGDQAMRAHITETYFA